MTSLFGGLGQSTANKPAGGLFGSNTAAQSNPTPSLFGGASTGQAPAQPTPSLFGNPQPQQNNTQPTPSLFGNPQAQQNNAQPTTSLFGNPQQQQNTNTQPTQSLFGNPQPQQNNSANASSNNMSTMGAYNNFAQSISAPFPANLSRAEQQDLARSRLQQAGLNVASGEKSVIDQAKTLIVKWDPNAQDGLLQTYLYNVVSAAYAPFYNRNPDESEREWEKALANAPKITSENGTVDETQKFVPVLVRGFFDLGKRVEVQAATVREMRARLHEMNNSLEEVMRRHSQQISVRVDAARRQHVALRERTLRLAVKVQGLRNRGYALDAAEESLRKELLGLQQKVQDPGFTAREEEIWARMVILRERARWLEQDGKKVGQQLEEQQGAAQGIPDEILQKTKKILQDYDVQLRRLSGELENVKKEFADWEGSQLRVR